MITISHFLRNKSRKIGRKLCASDHRLRAASDFIKANRLNRALHEIEMAIKINEEVDAVLDELWERGKVEKKLREEFNKINK